MLMALNNITIMAQNKITQTAGRAALGEFAPKFAELNDDVLFGEAVWNDSTLSLHDHSLVTISILLGKGMVDSSFRSHLEMGKKHGITRREIAALLTQAAFYAGWPNAWAGFRMAKEVWADNDAATEKERFQQQMIFPIGDPNTAYAKYFIGNSYLARISTEQIPFSNVTFEPGCRNNWHIHQARQARARDIARHGHPHSRGREALARSGQGQLVRPPGLRDTRRGHFQRMAGAGDRRGIQQTEIRKRTETLQRDNYIHDRFRQPFFIQGWRNFHFLTPSSPISSLLHSCHTACACQQEGR